MGFPRAEFWEVKKQLAIGSLLICRMPSSVIRYLRMDYMDSFMDGVLIQHLGNINQWHDFDGPLNTRSNERTYVCGGGGAYKSIKTGIRHST